MLPGSVSLTMNLCIVSVFFIIILPQRRGWAGNKILWVTHAWVGCFFVFTFAWLLLSGCLVSPCNRTVRCDVRVIHQFFVLYSAGFIAPESFKSRQGRVITPFGPLKQCSIFEEGCFEAIEIGLQTCKFDLSLCLWLVEVKALGHSLVRAAPIQWRTKSSFLNSILEVKWNSDLMKTI